MGELELGPFHWVTNRIFLYITFEGEKRIAV